MRAARLTSSLQQSWADLPVGQRRRVPTWELAFLLLAALNYWTDLLRLMFPGVDSASVAFRLTHFAFYGAFAILLARHATATWEVIRRVPLLLAFLLLPLASALWSINPGETATRAVALIGSSLFGLYVAGQVQPLLALRILAWTGGIAAALSLILIFAFPSVGLMSEGEYVNVWSGAFIHKNGLGQMTALGAIISIIVLLCDGWRRNRLIAAGLVLNLVLLAGSRSLTSQLVFLASLFLIATVGRFVRFLVRHALVAALVLALVSVGLLATVSIDDVFILLASFGKDASMSSRVPLWQMLAGFIDQHYWLGWGYEAFFSDANFAYRLIEAKLHFKPYYSHNGYIETWLALGAVGFAMMLALLVRFAWRAATFLYREDRNPLFLLCFTYVPVFLIQNTAEVTILQRNSISWALFVMLYGLLARLADARPTRSQSIVIGEKLSRPRRERLPVA